MTILLYVTNSLLCISIFQKILFLLTISITGQYLSLKNEWISLHLLLLDCSLNVLKKYNYRFLHYYYYGGV
jgi:hypothetical protein